MSLFTAARKPAERRDWMPSWVVPTPGADYVTTNPRTADQALRHTTVWGCISLIAEVLGSLPLDVFKRLPDGSRREVAPPQIITAPSLNASAVAWRTQFVTSLLAHGNAYGQITSTSTATGYADRIEWLDPTTVRPQYGADKRLMFHTNHGVFSRQECVHVPGLMVPGNPVGMSPIAHFAQTIGLGLSAQAFGANWFADGAHPSAIIYSDRELDAVAAKSIKRSFMAAVTGREPAVMGSGLKYEQVSVPASESQFLDAIGANAAQIAGQIFRVPPEMLGIASSGSSVTYANREQRSIDFLTFTLLPWITRFESMMSDLVPRGQFVKLNVDALLRSDTHTAHTVAMIDLQNGIRSKNEVRALFDLSPIPDGDSYATVPLPTVDKVK